MCTLCKSKHDNNQRIINYDEKIIYVKNIINHI